MAKNQAEKTEEVITVPAGAEAPAPKAKKSLSFSVSPNLLAFVVVIGMLGYLIYGSWQAFQINTATPLALTSPTPNVPELKLNQDNKRLAPVITVDPNGVGKVDPFSSQ